MKRVYVAGPMSGIPALNFPAFHAAAAELRAAGVDAVNPAEICTVQGMPWTDCMRADLTQLLTCQGIYRLPGWSKSRGASLEVHIGQALGMEMTGATE